MATSKEGFEMRCSSPIRLTPDVLNGTATHVYCPDCQWSHRLIPVPQTVYESLTQPAGEAQQAWGLSKIEAQIYAMLERTPARIVSRDLILGIVWGKEYAGDHHLLRVNITRLRHKLEAAGCPYRVVSSSGLGYGLYRRVAETLAA